MLFTKENKTRNFFPFVTHILVDRADIHNEKPVVINSSSVSHSVVSDSLRPHGL